MGPRMPVRTKKALSASAPAESDPLPAVAFPPEGPEAPPATVTGAIARHWFLVLAVTVLVAAGAVAYTYHQPKTYSATARVSMVQPANNQALGTPSAASPQQYVESQLLALESQPVAVHAAALANASLRTDAFTPADFSGPGNKVTVTTQASVDPNSGLVTVGYRASSPLYAATGANSLLAAYVADERAAVNSTYVSMANAINVTLQSVDSQLQSLSSQSGPFDTQLATSLVAQRTDLLQRKSLVAIDQQAALAATPSFVAAYPPATASNRKLTKIVPIGAVIGFILGACLAYGIESRRRRKASERLAMATVARSDGPGLRRRPSAWAEWETGAADEPTEVRSS